MTYTLWLIYYGVHLIPYTLCVTSHGVHYTTLNVQSIISNKQHALSKTYNVGRVMYDLNHTTYIIRCISYDVRRTSNVVHYTLWLTYLICSSYSTCTLRHAAYDARRTLYNTNIVWDVYHSISIELQRMIFISYYLLYVLNCTSYSI